MALSQKPWGKISETDYADAADYCSACLLDLNGSGDKTKAQCHLPVKEPKSMGGALNRNGMLAAQGALLGARGGVKLDPAQKRTAAKKLGSMMQNNDMDPAEGLMRMAGMKK